MHQDCTSGIGRRRGSSLAVRKFVASFFRAVARDPGPEMKFFQVHFFPRDLVQEFVASFFRVVPRDPSNPSDSVCIL